jgi:putative hemolysin
VLLSVSRGHVEAMAKSGTRAGKILARWKRRHIEVPIAAILILNTLAHTVGATVAGSSYEAVFDPSTLWIFSLVFTLAVLLFTEIIPKTLGVAFANRLAAPVTLFVKVLVVLLGPVLFLTSKLSKALTGKQKRPVTSVEEIRLLASLGSREGDVGPRVASFIEGVASLKELTVRDVMVPRGGIAYLSGDNSLNENLEIVRSSGHSRFPLTPTGDLDDVEGVVLAKELLFLDHDDPGAVVDWEVLKTPLLVVPDGKHLNEVLRLFQDQRKHLALVVDEYGGTQGVVTLEDVLEEIVGEIEDETDRTEPLIITRSDGSLMCRGWAETRKMFQVLGIEEKVETVTVGGFVADMLGRVPAVGDSVEWKSLRFEVTKATRRRAEKINVTTIDPDDPDNEGDEPDPPSSRA